MRKKPLGRPPASVSAETRSRILAAARDCFARLGYGQTTNKDIANAAGITTGAIYHYYDSKQELFVAVTREVTDLVFSEFESVAADQPTFLDKLRAVLDAASRLHEHDRTLARFSAICPIELQRHPELAAGVGDEVLTRGPTFFRRLVTEAKAKGELASDLKVHDTANMLVSVTIGLAFLGLLTDNVPTHRGAVVTVERLFDHGLGADSQARTTRSRAG